MHQHGYIGRKMRLPQLKEKPAIIIAAFGSSSRAKTALEIFRKGLSRSSLSMKHSGPIPQKYSAGK